MRRQEFPIDNKRMGGMNKREWIGACLVIAALVTGCHSGGTNQNSTNLRAVNAVIDAEPLDVFVDSNKCASAVAAGGVSGYCNFDAGNRNVSVKSTTLGTVLANTTLSFGSDANETIVFYGRRSGIQQTVLVDDTPTPPSGQLTIRAADFSPEASAVDVYLVTSSDISSIAPTIPSAAYPVATAYVQIAPGSYQIIVTTAGTKDILFQAPARAFTAGSQLTLLILPSLGGKLVNAMLLSAGSGASGTFIANAVGRLKAVNAIPGSTTLNFKADGTVLLFNVPFAAASSYVQLASGSRALAIEPSSAPGSNLASATQTIDPAKDYTMVAVNPLGQPAIVVFTDDNTVPATNLAKVRFANVMTGSTAVDVLVNFASQTTGLAPRTASPYFSLAAATSYTVAFTTQGGTTVIATFDTAALDNGAVYTIYLFGSPSAPQPIVVKDR
jgi:hypothetical protein